MALGALFVLASVGAALLPYLAQHHPLILLALSPWPRHQILVAPHTPFLPFMLVTVARGLATVVVAYELAHLYGPLGLEHFEARSARVGRALRVVERVFASAPDLLLLVGPGPLTAAFAAIARMPRWRVFPSLALGLSGWAFVNYRLGGVFAPWTKPILAFLRAHVLPATLACVAIVAAYELVRRRRTLKRLSAPPDEPS